MTRRKTYNMRWCMMVNVVYFFGAFLANLFFLFSYYNFK
jgi:hypothetical protein